jgi:outer membrane receptor for ferrienterochelin and colicins
VNDKIALVQEGTASAEYTYINIEKFISKGAELQAHFTMKNFHLNTGINYTGIYNTYFGAVGSTDFAWSPSINGSVDYTFSKTNTTVSAFIKYNGEQPVYVLEDDNSLGRYINNDYTLMDINIAQRLFKERLIVTGGVMNLLDVTNVSTYGTATAHSGSENEAVIGMGRSLFVKIQLHF